MILAVAMMVCLGGIEAIEVESTLGDGTQPCSLLNPGGEAPRPLLVFLHTWSTGYDNFDWTPWREEAEKRGWLVLVPHYQGPNCRPEACASARARQDILDAVDYVCAHYPVDKARIYLAGVSGGGHMSMVMAAHAPERWTAVSAWAGISDLAAWHKECVEKGRKYAGDIEAVAGGAPGSSDAVDRELYFRSPVHHLAAAKDLPLDLNTGIHDGHTGSVPIHHTLDAFNAVARCQGAKVGNGSRDRLPQPGGAIGLGGDAGRNLWTPHSSAARSGSLPGDDFRGRTRRYTRGRLRLAGGARQRVSPVFVVVVVRATPSVCAVA